MGISESRGKRRIGVIFNYGFILLTILMALSAEFYGWTNAIRILFWVAVVVALITFFPVYARTGLWRLAHSKTDKLDEREVQLTLGALRYAYAVFSIVALLSVLLMAVFEFGSGTLRLILFWVLLYLAHTLPSSVLAWSEQRV